MLVNTSALKDEGWVPVGSSHRTCSWLVPKGSSSGVIFCDVTCLTYGVYDDDLFTRLLCSVIKVVLDHSQTG